MSYHVNRVLVFFVLIFLIISCDKKAKFKTEEIINIRKKSMSYSQELLSSKSYWVIYEMANDSIKKWRDNKLGLWKYYDLTINYQIDSVFCINRETNKIVFSILRRQIENESVADGIWFFYGVLIDEKWYFFDGAEMVLPRENYQKDIHTPLSFEKLKQIATWNIYRGYLKQNQQGKWEINEEFFASLNNYDAYNYPYTTQEAWEESWLKLARENWEKADK